MLTKEEKKKIEKEVRWQTIIRTALRYSAGAGILILTIVIFSLDIFNVKKDTFSFTNYGFAVMAAYASVCFSWARNLEAGESQKARAINGLATISFYTGIIFILGSTFKYIYILRREDLGLFGFDVSGILKYLSYLCLTFALIVFSTTSISILWLIDKDLNTNLKRKLTTRAKTEKLKKTRLYLMNVLEKTKKKDAEQNH